MITNPLRRAGPGWTVTSSLFAAATLSTLAGCSREQGTRADAETDAEPVQGRAETVYVARLNPLNTKVAGSPAEGEVTFRITGDSLTIVTEASGVPPETTHWQHFHGFKDGRDAACPTEAADANKDGIVDLIETEAVSGTTMVPFNADPVAMNVPDDTYPKASATGTLQYQRTVSFGDLQAAFSSAFEGQELELEKRVVFLHGVPSGTKLEKSVASLGPIPAQVTIPIACGEIERAGE